jgi:hypothetical protein
MNADLVRFISISLTFESLDFCLAILAAKVPASKMPRCPRVVMQLHGQVLRHFNLRFEPMTPGPAKVALFRPRSCGFPAGLLAQPFYGWVRTVNQAKARFNGL